jgi:hypothetical protein
MTVATTTDNTIVKVATQAVAGDVVADTSVLQYDVYVHGATTKYLQYKLTRVEPTADNLTAVNANSNFTINTVEAFKTGVNELGANTTKMYIVHT